MCNNCLAKVNWAINNWLFLFSFQNTCMHKQHHWIHQNRYTANTANSLAFPLHFALKSRSSLNSWTSYLLLATQNLVLVHFVHWINAKNRFCFQNSLHTMPDTITNMQQLCTVKYSSENECSFCVVYGWSGSLFLDWVVNWQLWLKTCVSFCCDPIDGIWYLYTIQFSIWYYVLLNIKPRQEKLIKSTLQAYKRLP